MRMDLEADVVPNYLRPELTYAERVVLLDAHPIRMRSYVIPTEMLERTYRIIRERVWARRTGIFFYSTPRMGKSTCVGDVMDRLKEEFPQIHVSRLDARDSARPSGSHMYKLILEAEGHVLAKRPDAYALFNNVITDIKMSVAAKRGSQFVLLIDEAHLLNQTDLQNLLLVHNALDRVKIKMTTVSFAQPEIMHRRTALLASKQQQIIARFLSEPVSFEGCRAVIDFGKILNVYDVGSEFPENSGWSYTRFFLPQAFAAGFRLERYAAQIWEELSLAAKELSDGNVPMEHISIAIEHCLLTAMQQDCPNYMLSSDDIANAVLASNLAVFSALMHVPRG
jgi:hypothetical protein